MNNEEAEKIIDEMFKKQGFRIVKTIQEARELREQGYSFGYNPGLTEDIADPEERRKFLETYSFGQK